MRPEHAYYVGLALTALTAWHNGTARACVAAGVMACSAYAVGLLGPWIYLAIHIVCVTYGVAYSRCSIRELAALSIFSVLIAADIFEIGGVFSPHDAWGVRYWFVMAQLALFFPDAFDSFRRGALALRDHLQPGNWLRFELA